MRCCSMLGVLKGFALAVVAARKRASWQDSVIRIVQISLNGRQNNSLVVSTIVVASGADLLQNSCCMGVVFRVLGGT